MIADTVEPTLSFAVLYSKDSKGKKRKTYHDGFLEIRNSPKLITLYNEDGDKLASLKSFSVPKVLKAGTYSVPFELTILQYEIQVEAFANIPKSRASVVHAKDSDINSSVKMNANITVNNDNINTSSNSAIESPINRNQSSSIQDQVIDANIYKKMKVHQIVASEAILKSLYLNDNSALVASKINKGVILADEMGLGIKIMISLYLS